MHFLFAFFLEKVFGKMVLCGGCWHTVMKPHVRQSGAVGFWDIFFGYVCVYWTALFETFSLWVPCCQLTAKRGNLLRWNILPANARHVHLWPRSLFPGVATFMVMRWMHLAEQSITLLIVLL